VDKFLHVSDPSNVLDHNICAESTPGAFQIFNSDCSLSASNYDGFISTLKSYCSNRAVIMAAPVSSPGSWQSTYSSHKNDAYVSRYLGMSRTVCGCIEIH
jgi:hypothetical protein